MNTRREFIVLFSAAAVCGCRRQDIKTYTLEVPGLTEENSAKVRKALSRYNGVIEKTIRFDMKAKTLTLSYDSMQLAKTNIRMSVEEALSE